MILPGTEVRILDDKFAVAEAAAAIILDRARQAITERGRFKIVLAGGTTPIAIYHLLAGHDADWARWHIFHGDERCLPVDHSERNSLVADQAWLDQVAIPRSQVHVIAAQLGAEPAAKAYQSVVEAALPFDLVLLGMGEDGHTASLFPNHELPSGPLVVPVHDAPKPPPHRVSLTPKALCCSSLILFLITGESKRGALRCWQQGEVLPVVVVAQGAQSLALLDHDAADVSFGRD